LLGHAVKVSERQFPRLDRIASVCAAKLGIAPPTVYIVNSPQVNAATYGTESESFITVHSALVDHYSDEELLAVIGHECGHIHNRHVVYLTTLHYLSHMAGMFVRGIFEPAVLALRAWSRRAEITCDRAAMLCVGDAAIAERAIAKLALGSRKLYEELDIDVFLEQYTEGKASFGRFTELFATHPWLPKRVLAMREFAKSELFLAQAVPSHPGGGRTMTEVDDAVHRLLRGEA
jgi:Zn-dependent protease with chaperone function